MKKLILLSLAVVLCLPVAVYAASIGGAETQGKGKFALGLDTEYIFNRDMKLDSAIPELDPGQEAKNVEINKLYRVMTKASYGLLDNLDVYLKLGLADFEGEADGYISGLHVVDFTYDSKIAFAYGGGLKTAYSFGDNWLVGADLQYLRHKSSFSGKVATVSPFPPEENTWSGKATVQEWQIGPYVGYKIGNFVPYLGVKYSNLIVKAKDNEGDWEKYKADDNVGVFLGTDYKIGKNFSLNIEGRFIDETALSFAGSYRF